MFFSLKGKSSLKGLLIAALAATAISAPSASMAAQSPTVTARKDSATGGLYSRFEFHGPVSVYTFVLDSPDRFVVDVTGATLESGAPSQFDIDSSIVKKVRLAQNSSDPAIVRIVLDLKRSYRPQMDIDEASGVIVIAEGAAALPFSKVSVKKNSADVEVVMSFKNKPVFKREQVGNPPRYVLDFPGYTAGAAAGDTEINEGIVKAVRVSQFSSEPAVTRVVLETNLPAEFVVTEGKDGKTVSLKAVQPSVYGKKICVDAGHGGKDPGAQVKTGDEKDIVLSVALKLQSLLQKAGAKVIMTRSDDTFIELKKRAAIANSAGAELFISIHTNALINHEYKQKVRGIQVFHYKDRSKEFARTIRDSLAVTEAVGDWGVYDRSLLVLRETNMRAALAELGFMTHPDDMALLNNNIFQENAARGLFNGIEEFMGGRGKEMAALELPRDMVAHLPGRPFNYIYASTGNVLNDAMPGDYKTHSLNIPEIPDFVDVLPAYEAGLTHEVDAPAAEASGITKSRPSGS